MKKERKIKLVAILFLSAILSFNFLTTTTLALDNKNLKSNKENKVLPNITAKAAISLDLNSGEIMYSKNADKTLYPASVTKLMTALLFAENANPNDKIPMTKDAKEQPAFALNANYGPIEIGDSLTGKETMDALLLYSANDVAYMIADFVSKNSSDFIELMNKKAAELGMKDTHFVTANGLHNEKHYTTAFDLALLGKEVLKNSWIKETILKKDSVVEFENSKKRILLSNSNKELGNDGNIGAKTGFTTPAGRCLLSFYQRGDRIILGVVLGSEYGADDTTVFKDMKTLIDYSFTAEKETFKKAGDVLDKVTASYKAFGFFGRENSITFPVTVQEDINYYNNSFNNEYSELILDTKELSPWKAVFNSSLKISFKDGLNSTDLIANVDLSPFTLIWQNIFYYIITITITILVLILIIFSIRKSKTNRKRKDIFNRRSKIFK